MKNLAQKIAHRWKDIQLPTKRANAKRSSCRRLFVRPHTEASCFIRTTNFDKFCCKFSPSNILSNVLRGRSNEGITHVLCFYGFAFLSKSSKQNTYSCSLDQHKIASLLSMSSNIDIQMHEQRVNKMREQMRE